jgi:hypothetical protein
MTSRLELTPRSAEITLTSDPSLHKRYRARFEGQAPRVDVRNGTVAIAYDRPFPLFARRGRGAEIAVDPSVPWEVDVRGGVSRLSGDLTPVELGSLEIDGGVSKSALRLGRPTGRVVVRIRGGVSDLSIHRPADVPVRLRVRGGASRISLDEQRLGAAGGEVRLASLTDVGTDDRYEVEIHGGASKLTVATDLT